MIDAFGWQAALEIFAGLLLLMIPLAFAVATPPSDAPPDARTRSGAGQQTYRQALAEAFGHRSYILLVLGFFTCGFQLGFVEDRDVELAGLLDLAAGVGAGEDVARRL